MPVTRSAEKQMRASDRKRLRNQPVRTLCKTNITKAERAIFSRDLQAAQKAVLTAVRSLDSAAAKGIIHPNNAARRKSRLMDKLNVARAAASPGTATVS